MTREEAVKFAEHAVNMTDIPAVKEFYRMAAVALTQPSNEPLPVLVLDEPDQEYIDYICLKCKEIISQRRRGQHMSTVYQCKYHDRCGQRVDWANPEPYRRPPEGEADA